MTDDGRQVMAKAHLVKGKCGCLILSIL